MTIAKVDDKKRVVLPGAKPGQAFSVEPKANGFVLTEVAPKEPAPAKVHFAKEGGYTVLVSNRPIDEAALKAALEDFPP